jgi:hypothetical protein
MGTPVYNHFLLGQFGRDYTFPDVSCARELLVY